MTNLIWKSKYMYNESVAFARGNYFSYLYINNILKKKVNQS